MGGNPGPVNVSFAVCSVSVLPEFSLTVLLPSNVSTMVGTRGSRPSSGKSDH